MDPVQASNLISSIAPISDVNATSSLSTPSFSAALDQMEAQGTQVQEQMAQFMNGTSEVSVPELMVNIERNRLMLSLALQVRNKLVEGMQELYRTSI